MAKRLFTSQGMTMTGVATGTQFATANSYMALRGGSGTQLIDVLEILVSGKASASQVAGVIFTRQSTSATTPTAIAAPFKDGLMNPSGSALSSPAFPFSTASTQGTSSAATTDAALQLGQNAFGGILRWNAAPTQQWNIIGSAAPGQDSVLFNSTTAGGASTVNADAHIMYEPY